MPELPEVETLRRGITPQIQGQSFETIIVRETRLRWPVPAELNTLLVGQQIKQIQRRGKYLLFECTQGHLLIHLGMSGSLRLLSPDEPLKKHDHLDFIFTHSLCLRYHDPRRFGSILWTAEPITTHPLLAKLGIEPLSDDFNGHYLYQIAKNRQCKIKTFIMNNIIVVGVGNIYANEALFSAKIHPARSVATIDLPEYQRLAVSIQATLTMAIAQGGTTLRDFADSEGQPGYFSQSLQVYGREGQACYQCGTPIQQQRLSQRASYYCPICQV
ncbi:MAG: DNA-formamidopyrimidine glycosylase [Beggiatoa sp. IS2]|nr:MAG: DNA-formamidopyrimidine glycosylase [Beggiatoa sp. IS2]